MRLSNTLGLCPTMFHKAGSRREKSARVGMMSQLYQRLLASSSRRASRCGIFALTSRLNVVPACMIYLCFTRGAQQRPEYVWVQTFAAIIALWTRRDGGHAGELGQEIREAHRRLRRALPRPCHRFPDSACFDAPRLQPGAGLLDVCAALSAPPLCGLAFASSQALMRLASPMRESLPQESSSTMITWRPASSACSTRQRPASLV